MKDLNDFEHIENFLDDRLKGPELEMFESRLAVDKDFSELVNNFKTAIEGIRLSGRNDLKKKLEAIHEKEIQPNGSKIVRIKWYWTAASIIIVLAAALFVSLILNSKVSNEKLYSQYFVSQQVDNNTRANDQLFDTNYILAFEYYNKGDYSNAINVFTDLIATDPVNMELHFYQGISFMEISNFERAIESFEYIIDQKGIIFMKTAKWYLGLCYLKNNENKKARTFFEVIASDTLSPNASKAERILQKMSD
ncbi:tol-pal system YbgF family protein [candidate division KSB1 bacterium]